MKKIFFVVTLLALLTAAIDVQAQTKKKRSTKSKTTNIAKRKKSPARKTVAAPKNMLNLLQGRWQSLDDAKTFFVVEGDKQINYYGKDVLDTATINFYPEYPVKITDADPKLTRGEYMVATAKKNDYFIYSVETITASNLTLMYMPRGNVLRYKKVR